MDPPDPYRKYNQARQHNFSFLRHELNEESFDDIIMIVLINLHKGDFAIASQKSILAKTSESGI